MRFTLLITLFVSAVSSVSFAQVSTGTEVCFAAAVQTAANKIAKDSKTSGSVLNEIGFKADSCVFQRATEMLNCFDRNGVEQFDVAFVRATALKSPSDYRRMTYEFVTGTQGVDVHYKLFFRKVVNSNNCNYESTEVWTDGYEEAGAKTGEQIKLCINECFAAFDRPNAEFKACVSKCKE